MSNKFQSTLQNLPTIAKYLLVFGVIVFISFLFPNNIQFQYNFKQGETWTYEDLIAPFDFAIRKTDEELEAEIEELRSNFSPYYTLNPEIAPRQKQKFQSAFQDQLAIAQRDGQFTDVLNAPQRYEEHGIAFIDKIYNRGVVQLAPEHKDQNKEFVIQIVKGNTTEKQTIQNVFDVPAANELLTDSLPYTRRLREPDFLLTLLQDAIIPNVTYNDTLTSKMLQIQLNNISKFDGMVPKGKLIIGKNEFITAEKYQQLISYRQQYEQEVTNTKTNLGIFIGYFLLTSLIVGVYLFYLQYQFPKLFSRFSEVVFMLLWLVIYSYLVHAVEGTDSLSTYLIPFCVVPIVVKIFYNERLALFTHIVIVLIASFLSKLGYEFTFLTILVGIVAVLTNFDTRNWSTFFLSMFFIFLAYSLGYLGLSLVNEGSLANLDWSIYTWLFLNVFLTLLAYPLIPLLERMFGFTSSITLVELSDMNKPLLKELSINAPGTMQHSLQVANLAEAAASEIGADTQLVKVAALYHDIGKSLNPAFFIENQSDVFNPHSELDNFESARIIIDHVNEGVNLARKHRLPNLLIDFIKSHHGTTRVEYFYRKQLKDEPDREFDESLFVYPGPKPRSKEETILMMADSLEASSKSLKNPTGQDIDQLVDKIIAGKINNGQFEKSAIRFRELEICKRVFKQLLRSIYHVRIEYPEEAKPSSPAGG